MNNTSTNWLTDLLGLARKFFRLATLVVIGFVVTAAAGCNGKDGAGQANAKAFKENSGKVTPDLSNANSNPNSDVTKAAKDKRFHIDGQFDEWDQSYLITTDPIGDASGAFDVVDLMAVIHGDRLFVSFTLNDGAKSTLQNGPDSDGVLQLLFFDKDKKLTLDFRNRTFVSNNQILEWRDFDFRCLPTFASPRYELRVVLSDWDLTNVKIDFAGSDQLDKPVPVAAMVDTGHEPGALDLGKAHGAFRVANLNTLENGLANISRAAPQRRLLAAANADIYTFQEEWNEQKFRNALPALSDTLSAELQNHWFDGCAVVSRLPLVAIPMTLDRAAAGLVEVSEGLHVAVIAVHLKSAGYIGSREDSLRIQQTEQLVGEIKKMRQGDFGEDAKDAAVIIVGDYNLVGSRLPLDVLTDAGLKDVMFKDAKTGDAMTWQGEERTNFWPGRLDWLCHDQKLVSSKSLILNSRTLDDFERQLIGVEEADSLGSDHLMLIGDFEFLE